MNMFEITAGMRLRSLCGEWSNYVTNVDEPGPVYGEIVTVRRAGAMSYESEIHAVVWLEEFPGDTLDDCFQLCEFEIVE